MDETISLEEMSRRWEALLTRKQQSDELVRPAAVWPDGRDPFDCSDCAVPSAHALVEETVQQAIDEWRALDDRKIPEEDAFMVASIKNKRDSSTSNSEPNGPVAKKPKWYNMHVRLPESFDYATRNKEPPSDDGGGDRVIQLDNPAETKSYHQELWHLFQYVPTLSVLEKETLQGLSSPAMERVRHQWEQAKTLIPGEALRLGRLRYNDRHDAPETPFSPPSLTTKGTIVFEIWKGMIAHLKPSPSPAEERLVLEFRGEQTLADFHTVLVELSGDLDWNDFDKKVNIDEAQSSAKRSGMFLIEDKFYTFGEVDYSTPIFQWFRGNKKRTWHNLGIHIKDITVESMNNVRLEQIPMRIGMRYLHVHSGTIQSQVFLIDRRFGYPRQPALAKQYPIVHDMWSNGWSNPDCDGCRCRCAVMATSLDCDETSGHKALCQACADELQVPAEHRQRYNVWKNSGTIGAGTR